MKELISPLFQAFLGSCFIFLAAGAVYISVLATIRNKYYGTAALALDWLVVEEMPLALQKEQMKQYDKYLRSRKFNFYLTMGTFTMVALVFGWSELGAINMRWIDALSTIGMIINGYAILYAFHFNNPNKFISCLMQVNTTFYAVISGIYIGMGEYLNAFSQILMYCILFSNGRYFYNKRIKEATIEEIKKNGLDINGINVQINITPHVDN
jgi:hypothetical protein